MVKWMIRSCLLVMMVLSLNGCSKLKQLWGEKAPDRKTVVVRGGALPSFLMILDGNDYESVDTLEQWRESTLSSFRQLQGQKTDFISEAEIATLIRAKMISLGDSEEQSIIRAHSLIRLLGFKDGISMRNVDQLFSWLENNRARLRTFYNLFISDRTLTSINSSNVIQLIELVSSVITLGGEESVSAAEMNELVKPFIPPTLKYVQSSSKSAIAFGISFFASFCGDRVEANAWNGKKIGECLTEVVTHFKPLTSELDFIAGVLDPTRSHDQLVESNKQLVPLIDSWMKGHKHPPFPLSRISDFAKDLDIPRPYNFFKLTEWLPKLNPKNTTELFHPEFVLDIASVLQNWITTFTTVTADQSACSEADWANCAFTGNYETVNKLFNDSYATKVRKKDLRMVYRVSLFESIVNLAFKALDKDKTGYLGIELNELITVTIRAVDSHSFADNVIRRLQDKPVYSASLEKDLSTFQKSGLLQVAAMAADILPVRDNIKRTFWRKIKSQFTRKDKVIPNRIDALGLTGLIVIYDLITDMHLDYVKRYHFDVTHEGANDSYIKRAEIVKKIPQIMYDHFPRLYNSCVAWGFERTCGVVFTQILPNPLPGRDDIQPYEMDMMTLVAILAESIMNKCDRDSDGAIRTSYFDGNDEKTCVLKITQALIHRLMDANIMERDRKTERLVDLVTGNRFFRYIGKAALGLGSLDKIALYALPPMSFLPKPASLGSILSLTAELMNPDRVKAIKKGVIGPSEGAGPGDELVYLNQMTDHYLPQGLAPVSSVR